MMEKPAQEEGDSNISIPNLSKPTPSISSPKKTIQLGVVQSSSGSRSFASNLSKKSRWDQAPGLTEEEDINKQNIEEKPSEKNSESVKSIIQKFESISSSTDSVTDAKKDEDIKTSTQATSRVKLVRTNFTKSKPEVIVGSDQESKPSTKPVAESTTSKNIEISSSISNAQGPQEGAPVVASSKALQIISSNYDSPTDDSSQEGDLTADREDEKINPGDSAYASLEKLSLGENDKALRNDEPTAIETPTEGSILSQSKSENITKEMNSLNITSQQTLEHVEQICLKSNTQVDENKESTVKLNDKSYPEKSQEQSNIIPQASETVENIVEATNSVIAEQERDTSSSSVFSESNKTREECSIEKVCDDKNIIKTSEDTKVADANDKVYLGFKDKHECDSDDPKSNCDTIDKSDEIFESSDRAVENVTEVLKPDYDDEVDTTMEQMFSDNLGKVENVSASIESNSVEENIYKQSNVPFDDEIKTTQTLKSTELEERTDDFESNASLLEMLEEGNTGKESDYVEDPPSKISLSSDTDAELSVGIQKEDEIFSIRAKNTDGNEIQVVDTISESSLSCKKDDSSLKKEDFTGELLIDKKNSFTDNSNEESIKNTISSDVKEAPIKSVVQKSVELPKSVVADKKSAIDKLSASSSNNVESDKKDTTSIDVIFEPIVSSLEVASVPELDNNLLQATNEALYPDKTEIMEVQSSDDLKDITAPLIGEVGVSKNKNESEDNVGNVLETTDIVVDIEEINKRKKEHSKSVNLGSIVQIENEKSNSVPQSSLSEDKSFIVEEKTADLLSDSIEKKSSIVESSEMYVVSEQPHSPKKSKLSTSLIEDKTAHVVSNIDSVPNISKSIEHKSEDKITFQQDVVTTDISSTTDKLQDKSPVENKTCIKNTDDAQSGFSTNLKSKNVDQETKPIEKSDKEKEDKMNIELDILESRNKEVNPETPTKNTISSKVQEVLKPDDSDNVEEDNNVSNEKDSPKLTEHQQSSAGELDLKSHSSVPLKQHKKIENSSDRTSNEDDKGDSLVIPINPSSDHFEEMEVTSTGNDSSKAEEKSVCENITTYESSVKEITSKDQKNTDEDEDILSFDIDVKSSQILDKFEEVDVLKKETLKIDSDKTQETDKSLPSSIDLPVERKDSESSEIENSQIKMTSVSDKGSEHKETTECSEMESVLTTDQEDLDVCVDDSEIDTIRDIDSFLEDGNGSKDETISTVDKKSVDYEKSDKLSKDYSSDKAKKEIELLNKTQTVSLEISAVDHVIKDDNNLPQVSSPIQDLFKSEQNISEDIPDNDFLMDAEISDIQDSNLKEVSTEETSDLSKVHIKDNTNVAKKMFEKGTSEEEILPSNPKFEKEQIISEKVLTPEESSTLLNKNDSSKSDKTSLLLDDKNDVSNKILEPPVTTQSEKEQSKDTCSEKLESQHKTEIKIDEKFHDGPVKKLSTFSTVTKQTNEEHDIDVTDRVPSKSVELQADKEHTGKSSDEKSLSHPNINEVKVDDKTDNVSVEDPSSADNKNDPADHDSNVAEKEILSADLKTDDQKTDKSSDKDLLSQVNKSQGFKEELQPSKALLTTPSPSDIKIKLTKDIDSSKVSSVSADVLKEQPCKASNQEEIPPHDNKGEVLKVDEINVSLVSKDESSADTRIEQNNDPDSDGIEKVLDPSDLKNNKEQPIKVTDTLNLPLINKRKDVEIKESNDNVSCKESTVDVEVKQTKEIHEPSTVQKIPSSSPVTQKDQATPPKASSKEQSPEVIKSKDVPVSKVIENVLSKSADIQIDKELPEKVTKELFSHAHKAQEVKMENKNVAAIEPVSNIADVKILETKEVHGHADLEKEQEKSDATSDIKQLSQANKKQDVEADSKTSDNSIKICSENEVKNKVTEEVQAGIVMDNVPSTSVNIKKDEIKSDKASDKEQFSKVNENKMNKTDEKINVVSITTPSSIEISIKSTKDVHVSNVTDKIPSISSYIQKDKEASDKDLSHVVEDQAVKVDDKNVNSTCQDVSSTDNKIKEIEVPASEITEKVHDTLVKVKSLNKEVSNTPDKDQSTHVNKGHVVKIDEKNVDVKGKALLTADEDKLAKEMNVHDSANKTTIKSDSVQENSATEASVEKLASKANTSQEIEADPKASNVSDKSLSSTVKIIENVPDSKASVEISQTPVEIQKVEGDKELSNKDQLLNVNKSLEVKADEKTNVLNTSGVVDKGNLLSSDHKKREEPVKQSNENQTSSVKSVEAKVDNINVLKVNPSTVETLSSKASASQEIEANVKTNIVSDKSLSSTAKEIKQIKIVPDSKGSVEINQPPAHDSLPNKDSSDSKILLSSTDNSKQQKKGNEKPSLPQDLPTNENKQDIVNDSEKQHKAIKRTISDEHDPNKSNVEEGETKTPNKRLKKEVDDKESEKVKGQEENVESSSLDTSESIDHSSDSQTQKVTPPSKAKPVVVKEVPPPVRVSARQKQRQAAAAAALAAGEKSKSPKSMLENLSKKGKKSVSPTKELHVKVSTVKTPEPTLQSPTLISKSQKPSEIKSLPVSPKKTIKELGQDKLEPITLKLSKEENPVIVRSSSLSPKKVLSPSSPQTKTLGYTLKIGKDSTTIIPKDPTLSPRDRDSSPGSSKGDLSAKVGYLIKDTGLTITPVAPTETQEQKLNKITLKLSKAGGHPEIKQEKGETWKAIKKLGEIDIVPVEGKSSTDDLKRKDRSDHESPDKKIKLSDVTVEPSTSMSKLQGLLTQAPLNQSDDSEDVQFVGFSSPQEQSPNQQFTYDIGLVKQEPEQQTTPKKRGRPRKIPSSDMMHQVSHTLPPGLTAKDILAASLQHQTLQHLQLPHPPIHMMPEPPQEADCSQPMFPVPLFDLSEDTFMDPAPPTVFPDQVQPTSILRSARGRPIGRSRRPRGSGLLRAAERGGPRGRPRGSRGIKRMLEEMEALSYPDMEEPITLDNIDSQMGPRIIEPTGSQIAVSTMALLRKSIEGKKEFAEKRSRKSDGSESDQADLEAKVKEMKEKIEAAYQAELNLPKTSPEKESKKKTPEKGEHRKGPPELIPISKTDKYSPEKRKSTDEKVDHFQGIGKEFSKRKSTEENTDNKAQGNETDVINTSEAMDVEMVSTDEQIKADEPVAEPEPPPKPVKPKPKSKAEIKRIKREKDRLRREAKKLAALEALKAPPPNPSEEDTRMSASDPNADGLDDSFMFGIKKNRMEVGDPDGKEFTVDQIAEYQWPLQGGELYMIQEQISTYLGVKSFKRKYPDLKRRTVEMEEKTFLLESGLVSESMCDLGLTAVCSAEVLDIMFQDFQEQYEELRKHMREKAARELIYKQKERKKFEQSLSKSDLKEHAIQSALNWNQALNRSRTEGRRCHLDLQTWTIQYPRSRGAKMTRPTAKPGNYPVALIPGQYSDYYKRYTPQELRYWPVNTVLYGPLQPNERNGVAGSEGSQSDSEDSSSSDDSSESSSEGEGEGTGEEEDCKVCGGSGRRPGGMMQCSQCGHHIHVSCAELNPSMLAEVRKYPWQCSVCKTCQRCNKAKNESKMLFCDVCDRGYHSYCVGLRRVPAGSWSCNSCLSGGES